MKTALARLLLIWTCVGPLAAADAPFWYGTITFRQELKETGGRNGYPYQFTRVIEGTCVIDRAHHTQAKCTATFSAITKETGRNGRDVSGSTVGQGESPTHVSVTLDNGKLNIFVDHFNVPAKTWSAVLGPAQDEIAAGIPSMLVQESAADSDSLSGSKVIEEIKTADFTFAITVTWSLTRGQTSDNSQPKKKAEVPVDAPDEPKKPDVTLTGCTELGVDQQGTATAMGQPAGGSYRFWVDPSSTLGVQAQGATANLNGTTPGRATLHVEYSALDGKTAQASQPATCLRVDSINGGQPVPKIGLFDVLGKRTAATRSVPVSVQPSGAGDLLVFKPADAAVLSAVGEGDSVLLQGVRVGKTTIQATTKCGGVTGPIATVEVVRCDDEVLAKLKEEQRIVEENLKQALAEDGRIRNSKEFQETDIGESTADLLIKTGGLIIGTLAGGKGAAKGVETAADIYGYGSNLRDALKGDTESVVTSAVQTLAQAAKAAALSAILDAREAYQAADKFGKDLGALEAAAERLEATRRWIDHWSRLQEDVVRRQKICRTGGEEPPPQEPEPSTKKDPPKKDPQPRKDPQPKKDPPVTTEPPPPGNPPSEPPGDKPGEPPEEPPSPPPPTSEPRHFGLPYEEGKCGCGQGGSTGQAPGIGQVSGTGQAMSTAGQAPELGVDAQGVAEIGKGLKNLGQCVGQFRDGALTQYQKTLDEWQVVLGEIQAAAKADEAGRKTIVPALIGRMDALLGPTKDFDVAGRTFYEGFKACPAAVEGATGELRAVPKGGQ